MDGTLLAVNLQVVAQLERRLRPFFGAKSAFATRWILAKSEIPGNMLVRALTLLGLDERLIDFTDKLRSRRGVYPAPKFRLVPGVEETILFLKERYKLALVTTRSRYHVQCFLAQFPRIAPFISVTCALQDTQRVKPHPAPIFLAARRLRLPVAKCLMVGDTAVDVKAARRAGAWSAAVLCGFGHPHELQRAGAHVILPTTADLPAFLQKGQQSN